MQVSPEKAGRLLFCKSCITSSSTWSMHCRYLGSTPGVRPTEPGSSTPPATPAPPVSTVEPNTEPPVPPAITSAPETSETPVPPAITSAPETSATPESSPPPASPAPETPAPETPAPPASPPPSTGWCFRWQCGTRPVRKHRQPGNKLSPSGPGRVIKCEPSHNDRPCGCRQHRVAGSPVQLASLQQMFVHPLASNKLRCPCRGRSCWCSLHSHIFNQRPVDPGRIR